MFSEQDPAQALFAAALELLSRREHSQRELRDKLCGKFPEADFDALFLRLQELNYQSDRRFAEVFARSRVQRGQGPLRIRRELQQRGVSAHLIESALESLEEDWFQLAAELLQRKFRTPVNEALSRELQLKERARRQRYLAYRGFPSDAIHWALDAAASDLYSEF
ncbi:Regulatory protein RecX [Microbulbifer aggregans]|uniref:Regulatory protein RecX n=1 Tax=Microbulbifer aggregans TaxID=1769779 RepID=A0A1C9W8K8_9GAMM|nr:regulatory protein RecX [Microbulbifer aggregans]AOS97497.1 Regulatory protein RecX [Microbulbifer aggregans]